MNSTQKIDNIVSGTKDINSKLVELVVEQNRLRADLEKKKLISKVSSTGGN